MRKGIIIRFQKQFFQQKVGKESPARQVLKDFERRCFDWDQKIRSNRLFLQVCGRCLRDWSTKDRENLVESRAGHVISGAINLINYIKEHYDVDQAAELERRLLNSIRAQDPAKFNRGVRRFKDGS